MEFDTKVKQALVTAGWRHKNKVESIKGGSNGVDTRRRAAWFHFDVVWCRPPSRDLLEYLGMLPPIVPTTQAYASDIDRIELIIQCVPKANEM